MKEVWILRVEITLGVERTLDKEDYAICNWTSLTIFRVLFKLFLLFIIPHIIYRKQVLFQNGSSPWNEFQKKIKNEQTLYPPPSIAYLVSYSNL